MLTHYFSTGRRVWLISILSGLLVGLLVGCAHFAAIYHERETRFDNITGHLQHYLNDAFHELHSTIDALQPLTQYPCADIVSELTTRAAFTLNVRAFLLINRGRVVCSSATGAMDSALDDLVPGIDIRKPIDISVLPGTPMMPGKTAIALWMRNPQQADSGVFTSLNANLTPLLLYPSRRDDFSGIAVGFDHVAISSFSHQLVDPYKLNQPPVREVRLDGLPLNVYLYASAWPKENLQFTLLLAVMSALISCVLCFYIITLRRHPGKELLAAIRNNQFYVVYQPVIDSSTMKIAGVEALMRWKHPEAGEIPPDVFIHFAETQNLIVPLTRHLFKLIAHDALTLQNVLPPGSRLGVNIAPGHLHADSFCQDIRSFVSSLPASHFQLVLEMTERDMLNEKVATQLFDWLHEEGFLIAIDDFGTGHSALIYLERFRFDYLKIDRGFIAAIGTETITSPVLDTVLSLAKRMHLTTVAEGVETPEQASWLCERGVNYLQGYWISRPLTLMQLVAAHDEPAKYFRSSQPSITIQG
ncbi:phage resistance protein [Superficieibacter electus]|uniref:cyclic-guanylate-specific phosphodiesterase n=1 Tax=Superficieibacter electus TaxID=2022662 RepID=A0A2P5GWC6_9ENTR|nr:cyclic di-GMP phosphodiesterase [Superficieibacter electus]POP47840.1 phage resistance protein [Superficieibacter electus]POP50853.1 phage resistance protein [Superficieibacter electus]